jgi:hypothetical protein
LPRARKTTEKERRDTPRIPIASTVEIRIIGSTFQGPSENISTQGIFFVTDAAIAVEVTVSPRHPPLHGRIVRVQSVRENTLGIAVRFDEPLPAELEPEARSGEEPRP